MREKIKIIHIASSHNMGLTSQETNLAIAYSKIKEIESTTLSGENEQFNGLSEFLSKQGISHHVINGFDTHSDFLRLIKEFSVVAFELKPDFVTVNTNWQLVISGLSRLFTNQKYKIIYTIHGFRHNEKVKSYFARYLIGFLLMLFADRINAPTTYLKSKFSFLHKKIRVIPLGEDDIFFKYSEPPNFKAPYSFCFPGVFRQGKNQNILIQAFADYLNITNDRGATLYLPGEGELLGECKALAVKLGIEGNVIFPGQVSREGMVEIYRKCQICIVPSNDETFGHCIAEPLVMQRIVVTRNIGIAQDVIVNGTNGFIFDSRKDLVECLVQIRNMDTLELEAISNNAKKVGVEFKWSNVAARHLKELFSVVD